MLSLRLEKERRKAMSHEIRIIVEKVSVSSQEVVKRDTIKVYDIEPPESVLDLILNKSLYWKRFKT